MPKKLTQKQIEENKASMIAKVQEMSVNGIAPKSTENDALRRGSRRYFGGWQNFCKAAGIVPNNTKDRPKKPIRRGQLREAVGWWDVIDEYKGVHR